MQRLKKIVISGFKSFADRTEVSFRAGMNAIVGPNGCGKSNIADAFLWVLGEQSAKSLRGTKMQDIIFAGSATRKPTNVAEVTVSFLNSDKFLPIEYEEVAVTRKLYRSGESEYFLNNKPVRLKDVHQLFMHSGVGKEAFAIIGQGKVEELIHQSAQERRVIFEEVAGILHFLKERMKGKERLDQSDQNLLRIQDMHQEVQRQLKNLEKQAKAALEYKANKEELTQLEEALLVKRYLGFAEKQKKLKIDLAALEKIVSEALLEDSGLQRDVAKEKEMLKILRSRWDEAQEKLRKTKSDLEIAKRDVSTFDDRVSGLKHRQKKISEQLQEIAKQEEQLQQDKQKSQQRVQIFEQDLIRAQQDHEAKANELEKLQKVSSHILSMQKELAECRLNQQQEIHTIESDVKRAQLQKDLVKEKIEEKESRKVEKIERAKLCDIEAAQKKKELDAILKEIEKNKSQIIELNKDIEELEKQEKSSRNGLDSLRREQLEATTRYRMLLRLKSDLEGYSQSAKVIAQECKKEHFPLAGKVKLLAELLEVGVDDHNVPESVHLLERLYSSTFVVSTLDDLHALIEFAKTKKVNDLSCIVLSEIGSKKYDPKNPFKHAKEELNTHFFSSMKCAGSLQEALSVRAQGVQGAIWVSQGGYVDSQNVVFWGQSKDSGVFLRDRETKSLHNKIQELEKALHDEEQKLNALVESRSKKLMQRQEVDQIMRKSDMRLIEMNFGMQKLQKEKNDTGAEVAKIDQEVEVLKVSFDSFAKEINSKQEKLQTAKLAFQESETAYKKCELEVEARAQELKKAQETKQKAYENFEGARQALQKEQHLVEILILKEKEFNSLKAREENDRKGSLKTEQEFFKKKEEAEAKQSELELNFKEHEKHVTELHSQIKVIDEKLHKQEDFLKKAQDAKGENLARKAKLEGELGHMEEGMKLLSQELLERFSKKISDCEICDSLSQASIQDLEAQCKKLRVQVEAGANVNLMAQQEYEECSQRHGFLTAQLKDLQDAKNELKNLIGTLEQDSRKVFADTFENVRAAFQKNFQILFNGGEADIILEEKVDVLDAGVEIMAKPPGKQMRSLALLSGGEKCLTAIALLFALFEVRPAPFCILDEVDAPLDETNVERFGKLLKTYAEQCQFIVVTHNKRTMSLADILLGVSMQEKGVSQILSLDFKHYNEVEELVGAS